MKRAVRYLTDIALGRERGPGAFCLRPFLWAISLLYGFGVICCRGLYMAGVLKRFRAPVPVISIGNITAGGTGKTPFAAMLCRVLKEEGFSPMILTRGFMAGPGTTSDEAEMLKELVGPRVFTGADRVESFKSASKAGFFDCVVLDDGFQQWRFERDLDIVLLDSLAPFGNGALIPCGVLRETQGALRRAGVLVMTRSDRAEPMALDAWKSRLRTLVPKAALLHGVHQVQAAREAFTGVKISFTEIAGPGGAFCAIADPESFKRTLLGQGVALSRFTPFPDHFLFTSVDIQKVLEACLKDGLKNIFVTHKDEGKLKPFKHLFTGFRLIVIDVEFRVTYGKADLISSIRRLRRP